LACSARIRGWKRRTSGYTPAAIGFLPIPDPRTWPVDVRNWYRQVTGDAHGPLHVFIFHHGPVAELVLQDAVTALGILEVDPSEWHIEDGFPAFQFTSERIDEYSHRLRAAGYIVGVLNPIEKGAQTTEKTERAAVINIASVRSERSNL
jgi:hypothetical protein